MSDFRVNLACSAARLARAALRLLGRGGTAVPGKIALKICPELLKKMGKNVSVLLVTGTNGKSTTVGMLRHMLETQSIPYISNKSGANVISGITSDFIFASSLSGKPDATVAVMECDEGHFAAVAAALNPKAVVVTNLFDDQVDRLGGAMQTRSALAEGIAKIPNAVLCLNADDSVSGSLADGLENKTLYFGLGNAITGEGDSAFPCPRCGKPLQFDGRFYAHLGHWSCSSCGYSAPEADFLAKSYESTREGGSLVSLHSPEGELSFRLALPALYNVYNALAALAGAWAMGWDTGVCATALADFKAVFGRMETMDVSGTPVQMILVKNPAGFNRALDFVCQRSDSFFPVFCLNNNTGDGTDPSWINDVQFEPFFQMHAFDRIGVFGSCSVDMKKRLMAAGISEESLVIYDSIDALGSAVQNAGEPVVILPNYTAMLTVREKLASLAGEKKFWE